MNERYPGFLTKIFLVGLMLELFPRVRQNIIYSSFIVLNAFVRVTAIATLWRLCEQWFGTRHFCPFNLDRH